MVAVEYLLAVVYQVGTRLGILQSASGAEKECDEMREGTVIRRKRRRRLIHLLMWLGILI